MGRTGPGHQQARQSIIQSIQIVGTTPDTVVKGTGFSQSQLKSRKHPPNGGSQTDLQTSGPRSPTR